MSRCQLSSGFDGSELDDLERQLVDMVERTEPREMKRFLNKEGAKLRTKTKKEARMRVKKKTGTYLKRIKKGKPYTYLGEEQAVRVYSSAPHAHLIEYGHRGIKGTGENAREVFIPGKRVFEKARKDFMEAFYKDIRSWLDNVFR